MTNSADNTLATWYGADLGNDRSCGYTLSRVNAQAVIRAFTAPEASRSRGTRMPGSLRRVLDCVASELSRGRGYALVRGLPVGDLDASALESLALTMSGQLGEVVPQDQQGTLVTHVRDTRPDDGAAARGFTTNGALPFHVDSCDVAGLLCVRAAGSGGTTVLVSTGAVHRELSRRAPEALRVLRRNFAFDRRWEGPTEEAYFESRVFSVERGQVWGRYERCLIETGTEAAGRRLSDAQRDALDALDQVLETPELWLPMRLAPGDALYVNNHLIMHRRDSFADSSEESGRLLLRTWVRTANEDEVGEGFRGPRRFAGVTT